MIKTAQDLLQRFVDDRRGSAAMEYGLLVVFFVAICMAVIEFFGGTLGTVQGDVTNALTTATGDGSQTRS